MLRKVQEFYWTVTGAIGLRALHGKELAIASFFAHGWVLAYPLAWALRWLQQIGFHVVAADWYNLEPIGHLALDFDCFFKARILRGSRGKVVVLMASRRVGNDALLQLWRGKATFVAAPRLARLGIKAESLPFSLSDTTLRTSGVVMRGASQAHRIQADWGARQPLLAIPIEYEARGRQALCEMGMPDDAWFVCVHSREAGFAPQHEAFNSFRNADIADFVPAMQSIVQAGGYCIRMGDATMKPLPQLENVFDYAKSGLKSDWLDLFLCARCRFFLGTSSGLYCVSGVFGRPTVQVNVTPMGCTLSQFPGDICLPKLLRRKSGELLSFEEAYADESASYRMSSEFVARELSHVENAPQEIAAAAMEMLTRLDCRTKTIPEDDVRQKSFRAFIKPHHYSYFSAGTVGAHFMKDHEALL